MPRYDVAGPDVFPGNNRCRVYDATGRLLSPLAAADTDTGEVTRLVTDAAGNFAIGPDRRVLTERAAFPAPLRVELIDDAERV